MPHCSSPPVSRSKHSRPDPIPAAHSGRSRSDLFGIIGLSCMQHGPHPTALWPSLHKKKISVNSHQIPATCQACTTFTTLFFLKFFATNILGHILGHISWGQTWTSEYSTQDLLQYTGQGVDLAANQQNYEASWSIKWCNWDILDHLRNRQISASRLFSVLPRCPQILCRSPVQHRTAERQRCSQMLFTPRNSDLCVYKQDPVQYPSILARSIFVPIKHETKSQLTTVL